MEDRETARMRKYGESKTTRIMMTTVPHVTSGLGPRKFQADGFLLTRVFLAIEGGNFFRNIDAYRNNCAASRYVSLNCSLNIEIVFNI